MRLKYSLGAEIKVLGFVYLLQFEQNFFKKVVENCFKRSHIDSLYCIQEKYSKRWEICTECYSTSNKNHWKDSILSNYPSDISISAILDKSDYIINRWNFVAQRTLRELIFAGVSEVQVCVKACNSCSVTGLQLADTIAYIICGVLLGEHKVRDFILGLYFHYITQIR